MKQFRYIFALLVLFAVSCDLNKDLENPNEVNVNSSDPDLLLNNVELEFASFFARATGNDNSLTNGVDGLVRMSVTAAGFTYQRAFTSQQGNSIWIDAYQNTLVNIETLLPLATAKGFTNHTGVAKIMKAYVYITLVDLYGDVPRSNAIGGDAGKFNPTVDAGKDVYDYSIALLDEAIADLDKTASGKIKRDVYYSGDITKWKAAARTIQLKAWLNISTDPARKSESVAAINKLLAADIIDTDAEEFTYKYGTADVPARSRSPLYRQYYRPQAASAGGYIGNYFLKQVYKGKGVEDPRWRYYFYRQVGSIARALQSDNKSITCGNQPKPAHYGPSDPFCSFEPGFYGRDQLDGAGTPPDSPVITCAGVYPAGGKSDTNNGDASYLKSTIQGDGGNGAGIEPILMSWFVDFMKAEAVLRLGIAGDARALMLSGVNKSVNRVRSFANSLGQSLPAGLEPIQDLYTSTLTTIYNNSSDKLDVVMKEYYISLYGNAIEAYNMYRRTSSPKNMQLPLSANPGAFFRSLVYPAIAINSNTGIQQKVDGTVKVFWDKNPDVLK